MVLSVHLHNWADLAAVRTECVWTCEEQKNLFPFAGDQALPQTVHSVPRSMCRLRCPRGAKRRGIFVTYRTFR